MRWMRLRCAQSWKLRGGGMESRAWCETHADRQTRHKRAGQHKKQWGRREHYQIVTIIHYYIKLYIIHVQVFSQNDSRDANCMSVQITIRLKLQVASLLAALTVLCYCCVANRYLNVSLPKIHKWDVWGAVHWSTRQIVSWSSMIQFY